MFAWKRFHLAGKTFAENIVWRLLTELSPPPPPPNRWRESLKNIGNNAAPRSEYCLKINYSLYMAGQNRLIGLTIHKTDSSLFDDLRTE
jgi:hypothetical protein